MEIDTNAIFFGGKFLSDPFIASVNVNGSFKWSLKNTLSTVIEVKAMSYS